MPRQILGNWRKELDRAIRLHDPVWEIQCRRVIQGWKAYVDARLKLYVREEQGK